MVELFQGFGSEEVPQAVFFEVGGFNRTVDEELNLLCFRAVYIGARNQNNEVLLRK